MTNLIVSPYSLSFEEIKNELQVIVSNSSSSETWKDFYTAGAGETLLELDAAVALFLAFHAIVNRRESLLSVAKSRPSIVGLGESLGYNSSRGRNLTVNIEVVPTLPISLDKWMVVGQYMEYDVIFMPEEGDNVLLTPNVVNTLRCVIGNSETQRITIENSLPQQFTFTSASVTDDIRLVLNNTEVPISCELKDATLDKYITLTNSFGAVDVFYNNLNDNGIYKYNTGDTLYLQYIARNQLTYNELNPAHLLMYNCDRIENILLVNEYINAEDINSIKVNAPIQHETNNIVRARKDFAKVLKQRGKNIVTDNNVSSLTDVNDLDITPGLIALSYIKRDTNNGTVSLLTSIEKEKFLEEIETATPDGVTEAIIVDPVPVTRMATVNIKSKQGESFETTFLGDLDTIINNYMYKLGTIINLDDIEHDIERLKGVKTARIDFGISEYKSNTAYKKYDKITVPNILYGDEYENWTLIAKSINPKTGTVEPDWAFAKNEGDRIIDNNFIWENRKKTYSENVIGEWEQNKEYSLFTDIKPEYTVDSNTTLGTEPKWGDTLIKDGNIVWNKIKTLKKYLGQDEITAGMVYEYLPNSNYMTRVDNELGYMNKVIVKEDTIGIYSCMEVKNITGSVAPNWDLSGKSDNFVSDNAIIWEKVYQEFKLGKKYHVGDKVGVVKQQTNGDNKLAIYECTAITGTGATYTDDNYNLYKNQWGNEVVTVSYSGIPSDSVIFTMENYEEFYENGWEGQPNVLSHQLNTEYNEGDYISVDDGIFVVVSNKNTKSGEDTIFNGDYAVVDNVLTWNLDTTMIGDEEIQLSGTIWKPSSIYNVTDKIIVEDAENYYVYQCVLSKTVKQVSKDVVFSAVSYAGLSGTEEPNWSNGIDDDGTTLLNTNVIDNDILWTRHDKSPNESSKLWSPSTKFNFGDVIYIPNDADVDIYYKFNSLIGKTGSTPPSWVDIENNLITDGNITWQRLIEDENSIKLGWNEYLELEYTVTWN